MLSLNPFRQLLAPYTRRRGEIEFSGMTQVVELQANKAPREVIQRALEALAEGQLVAFPTETVYGVAASALKREGVERLRKGKGRPESKPLTLAITSAAEALDWVPEMSHLGRRLANRCWPGPVTLVFSAGAESGLVTRLPEEVRQYVCPSGSLGLRVPAHEVILQTLRQMPGPLVLTSANRSGEPSATTAADVVRALGDDLALVIDAGPSHYGQASTVVQVDGDKWQMLREGVVGASELGLRAAKLILFICTGNTCRSPMAEGLCKKLLADQLGCRPEELPERGIVVLSAGLAAMMGGGAAPEAIETARELGVDLTAHSSRPLTAKLAGQADLVIGMTRGHVLALTSHFPSLGPCIRLLSPEGDDLADPVGCDRAVYRECAEQILRHLQRLMPELSP
jgi:tRNA threonylcarbamoyl adenosine modification protein (Sua5/YciO/YrdC/YwlC family)